MICTLTLTSQYAKIPHADRREQGDAGSDRRGTVNGARRSAPGTRLLRTQTGRALRMSSNSWRNSDVAGEVRSVRYWPQQMQADCNHQIQMENGLYPAYPELRRIRREGLVKGMIAISGKYALADQFAYADHLRAPARRVPRRPGQIGAARRIPQAKRRSTQKS